MKMSEQTIRGLYTSSRAAAREARTREDIGRALSTFAPAGMLPTLYKEGEAALAIPPEKRPMPQMDFVAIWGDGAERAGGVLELAARGYAGDRGAVPRHLGEDIERLEADPDGKVFPGPPADGGWQPSHSDPRPVPRQRCFAQNRSIDLRRKAGMHWTVQGANAIIALRCSKLSGCYEDFWERRYDRTVA